MYLLAVAAYAVLGSRQPVPLVFPDEFTYGHLAASIAQGHGLSWYGADFSLTSALYVYVIAPFWAITSGTGAYALSKLFGAVALSAVCIPVWLLVRKLTDRSTALLCAALSVGGIWMTASGYLLTEVLAIPLAIASLAASVAALHTPGRRSGWLALGFAVLATWARIQLGILFPIIAMAFLADSVRAGGQRSARLRRHLPQLAVSTAVTAAGILAALADRTVLGSYAGVTQQRPALGHAASRIAETGVGLLALCALLPAVLCAAFGSQRRAWRDGVLGPLLTVTLIAAIAFVVESGWFVAGQPTHWHIERYVAYPAIMLVVTAVVGVRRGFADVRRIGATAAVAVAACLLMPGLGSALEEPAYRASALRPHELLGTGDQVGLAIFAAVMGIAGIVALTRGRAGAMAIGLIVGIGLIVQSGGAWQWQIGFTRGSIGGFPHDRGWLRHDARDAGEVGLLLTGHISYQANVSAFFSPIVTKVYRNEAVPSGLGGIGRSCYWQIAHDGALKLTPECGPMPGVMAIDAPEGRLVFRGERVLGDHGPFARAVALPPAPRLLGYVKFGCPPAAPRATASFRDIHLATGACTGHLSGFVASDGPATLRFVFAGGTQDHYVSIAGKPARIAAGRQTTVALPIAAGTNGFTLAPFDLPEDWTMPNGTPRLLHAELENGGHTERIF